MHYSDSHLGLGELHSPVEIHVLTKPGMAGYEHPRADVVATIQGTVAQDWQAVQVWVWDGHFLAGCVGDDGAGSPFLDALDKTGDDFLHRYVKVIGERRLRTEQVTHDTKWAFFYIRKHDWAGFQFF